MFHKIPGTKASLYQGKFISYDKEGDEDTCIEGGFRKLLDTHKGGSEKIVGLGGESKTICLLQSRPMTLLIGWLSTQQFNDLCYSAISCGLQI